MHKGKSCCAKCAKENKSKEKFKIPRVPRYSAVSGTVLLDAADVIRGAASAGVKGRLARVSALSARLALYKKAKALGLGN